MRGKQGWELGGFESGVCLHLCPGTRLRHRSIINKMAPSWKLDFCKCTEQIGPCLLICCCGWLGLAIVQYCALKEAKSESPSPIVGCLATCCCGCLGAAWNRQAIRRHAKMDEDFWTDCAAYNGGCVCCMGVQELAEVKGGATKGASKA